MKKLYIFITLLSLSFTIAQNGAPASPYYNGFNFTLTGTALRDALATKITTTHTRNLSYSEVWSALKIVDLDPTNSANVLLVYGWENGVDADVTNDRSRDKNNNGGSNGQWNREHIFAQALGDPDLGQAGPGADAQMLRACDVQRNGFRANRKFAASSGNSATVGLYWYPGDEWKGDCARIVMYMYLRYGSQCLPEYVFTGTPVASDANMLDLLLQWNAEDPVSQYEDNRNTYLGTTANTYGQGNRNPFIDNPYLATVIWGGPAAQNRWPGLHTTPFNPSVITSTTVYPNPSEGSINIVTDLTVEDIQLISISGQLMMQIKKPVFVNNALRVDNLPKGFYFLKLSTEDEFKSITKKIMIN
jgi:endonuclease I